MDDLCSSLAHLLKPIQPHDDARLWQRLSQHDYVKARVPVDSARGSVCCCS